MNHILLMFSLMTADETFLMPPPTKEIEVLVGQLGNDEWRVREKADRELRKLGWAALKAVYKARRETTEPEVAMRAGHIYSSYFAVRSDDKDVWMPSIWFLNEKLRFPDGFELVPATEEVMGSACKCLNTKDVAQEYYDRAMSKLKRLDEKSILDTSYKNEWVAKEAMAMYVRDRLLRGEKQADLRKVLNEAAKNNKECLHWNQTDIMESPTFDWWDKPPGPMLPKDDYREAST